ncbi:MAG: hypothetical protein WCG93_13990 [Paludibacter sp.]
MSENSEKRILLNVEIQSADAIKKIAELKIQVDGLKAEQIGLDKSTESGRQKFEMLGQQIKALNTESKTYEKQIQSEVKLQNEKTGSIQSLKAQLSLTTAAYNDLTKAERDGSEGKQKAKDIKATSDELKKLETQLGNSTRGIGEYERGMTQLPGAAGATTKSLLETGKAMWALVANPIGATIAAIAGVFYTLYSVLKNYEPVVRAVEQGFAAVGAVITVLKEGVLGLITGQKSLSETTNGLGTSMANAAKEAVRLKLAQQELGEANQRAEVSNARTKTQIDQLILQSKNRTLTEAERMAMIDKALALEAQQYKENKSRADEELKITQDKIISEYTLTKEEAKQLRLRGVEYAQQLKTKKAISEDDLKDLTSNQVKVWGLLDQSNAIREKAMNREDVLADKAAAKKEKADAAAVTANEKATVAHEKAMEKELKSDQNILSLKIANQKNFNAEMLTGDSYYSDRLDMINSNWNDEKKIIDKELAYKKINAQEAALKYVDAEKKKNDSIKALSDAKLNQLVNSLQYEMQLQRSKDDEVIAGTKRTAQEQYFSELSRIQQDKNEQIKEQNLKLASDKTYQVEHDKQIALITQKSKTTMAQANAVFDEKENQRKIDTAQTDLNNELAAVQNNIDLEYDLKLKALEANRTAELLAAETTGASVALINAKFNKLEAESESDKNQKKFEAIKKYADAAMGVLSAANNLAKEIEAGQLADAESANSTKVKDLDARLKKGMITQKQHDDGVAASATALDKKKAKIAHDEAVRERDLNIFKTIINTAAAIVGMLKSPGGIPGAIMAVAAGVTGAIELGTIMATPIPKAATGGLVVGNSHSQGGVLMEVEGGEMIINKKATAQYGGLLAGLNNAGNNPSFIPQTPRFTSDGGYGARSAISSSGGVTKEEMTQAMKEAVSQIKVYATIEDIKKGDKNYTTIQERGSY